MAYTINRTDGTIVATVSDGQIDQASTDITLIGKNFAGFGEYINENLVKILENFASDAQPTQPLTGQLWYDITENRIKVYSGTEWKAVGTSALAASRPLDISTGDFWFDNVNRQLFFYDGVRDYLIGPDYTASQGQSGLVVESIEDSSRSSRTIVSLYVSGTRVGFYSTSEFTPRVTIPSFDQTSVKVGYNSINSTFKFHGIATNSEALGGFNVDSFARKNQTNIFSNSFTIATTEGLRFGTSAIPQGHLGIEGTGDVFLRNTSNLKQIKLLASKNDISVNILEAQPSNSTGDALYLMKSNVNSITTVGGNLTVVGNLTVQGSTTIVTSEEVKVRDKLIELAVPSVGSPQDIIADGGGIVLKGDTDHSLTWDRTTDLWSLTESLNIPAGAGYYINGTAVIYDSGTGIALDPSVTSAPGLTQFGNQINMTVDNISVNNNRISNNGVTGTYSDGDPANPSDILIEPRGNIQLIGTPNPKIWGASTTNELTVNQVTESFGLSSNELSELTTKRYVTGLVRTRNVPLTMDITGFYPNEEQPMSVAQVAAELLRICPPNEFELGTLIRISTVRYFVENVTAVTPTLTTTVLHDVTGAETPGGSQITTGVVREVTADEIPAKRPPRLYPIRGIWVFTLNAPKTAWVEYSPLTEDQTDPTDPLTGLGNFIRP